jgi:hypothetical protein
MKFELGISGVAEVEFDWDVLLCRLASSFGRFERF